jgi:hypothetical protein
MMALLFRQVLAVVAPGAITPRLQPISAPLTPFSSPHCRADGFVSIGPAHRLTGFSIEWHGELAA